MNTTMKTKVVEKLKYVRFLPLLACGLVAVGMCAHLCLHAAGAVISALGGVALSALWIGGPFLLAICLAFLAREKVGRILFDLALVGLVLMDFVGLALCLLPFIEVEGVFTLLPLLQFGALTGLLVMVQLGQLLVPVVAKQFRSRPTDLVDAGVEA